MTCRQGSAATLRYPVLSVCVSKQPGSCNTETNHEIQARNQYEPQRNTPEQNTKTSTNTGSTTPHCSNDSYLCLRVAHENLLQCGDAWRKHIMHVSLVQTRATEFIRIMAGLREQQHHHQQAQVVTCITVRAWQKEHTGCLTRTMGCDLCMCSTNTLRTASHTLSGDLTAADLLNLNAQANQKRRPHGLHSCHVPTAWPTLCVRMRGGE